MRLSILVVFAVMMGAISGIYRYVVHEVTSGQSRFALPQSPQLGIAGPIDLSRLNLAPAIDTKEIQRLNAQAMASQIQANVRRMQDMSAYTRNPVGWHGLPPH